MKFGRQRSKSHVIQKCSPPWHELHHHRLHSLYCYSGLSTPYLCSSMILTYIQLKVRFALSSSSVFSQTDTSTDSETFYHSLLDLFEDPDESKEVDELLTWWNRYYYNSSPFRPAHISMYPARCSLLPLPPSGLLAPTVPCRKSESNALRLKTPQVQT